MCMIALRDDSAIGNHRKDDLQKSIVFIQFGANIFMFSDANYFLQWLNSILKRIKIRNIKVFRKNIQ